MQQGRSQSGGEICIRNKNMPTPITFLQAWSLTAQQRRQEKAGVAEEPFFRHTAGTTSRTIGFADVGDINIPPFIPLYSALAV